MAILKKRRGVLLATEELEHNKIYICDYNHINQRRLNFEPLPYRTGYQPSNKLLFGLSFMTDSTPGVD